MMWAMAFGALLFALGVVFGYGIAVGMMRTMLDSDYVDDEYKE